MLGLDQTAFVKMGLCGDEKQLVIDVAILGSYIAMIFFSFKVFEQFTVTVTDVIVPAGQIKNRYVAGLLPFFGALGIITGIHYLIRTQTKVCTDDKK